MHHAAPFQALSAAATIILISGCSGSLSTMRSNGVVAQSFAHAQGYRDGTGIAPQFLDRIDLTSALQPPNAGGLHHPPYRLAVTDLGVGAVKILNRSFSLIKTIVTPGVSDFYDESGVLYVANGGGGSITEYHRGSYGLKYTYNSGVSDPVSVAVDEKKNVYVADYGFGSPSVVVEYPQGTNTPLAICSTGLANEGIAIDGAGNVLVSGQNPSGSGNLIEYTAGLVNCPMPIVHKVTFTFAGGLYMDRHGLVACDQPVGVDRVSGNYDSILSTITGATDSFRAVTNRAGDLIFIADPSAADVLVDLFPSGTPYLTLNGANGLSDPSGVAAYPVAP